MLTLSIEGRRFSWRIVAHTMYRDTRRERRVLGTFVSRRAAERALTVAAQSFMLGTNMPHSLLLIEDYRDLATVVVEAWRAAGPLQAA